MVVDIKRLMKDIKKQYHQKVHKHITGFNEVQRKKGIKIDFETRKIDNKTEMVPSPST